MLVLAVDPGREKCGLALADADGRDVGRRIVARAELASAVDEMLRQGAVDVLVVGDGTESGRAAGELRATLAGRLPPLELVNEKDSTLEARALFFADHPPRGLWRLVPLSLQTPEGPYDDYAALVLARRYLGMR